MNDEEQSGLTPAEEARIRSLLADARHDEPMPDAVVARLDRVLAGLAAESSATSTPTADVVPLAERRRRATRLLVAAAAVVVAGVGIGQVVSDHQGSADSAATSPEADGSGLVQGSDDKGLSSDSGGSSGAGSSGGGSAPASQPGSPLDLADQAALKVRPQHFARDSRLVQLRAQKSRNDTSSTGSGRAPACDPGSWGAGTYVPVRYGQAPGYLVLRRPNGDSQVADLFLCDGADPVRSITLPHP